MGLYVQMSIHHVVLISAWKAVLLSSFPHRVLKFRTKEYSPHIELDHKTKLFSQAKLFCHHKIIHQFLSLLILLSFHHKIIHHPSAKLFVHQAIIQFFHADGFISVHNELFCHHHIAQLSEP